MPSGPCSRPGLRTWHADSDPAPGVHVLVQPAGREQPCPFPPLVPPGQAETLRLARTCPEPPLIPARRCVWEGWRATPAGCGAAPGQGGPACVPGAPHSQHGQQRLLRPAGLGGPARGMEFLACQQGGRVPVVHLGSLFWFRVKVMMACEQCAVPEVSGPRRRQLSLKMPFSRLRTLSLGYMGVSLT